MRHDANLTSPMERVATLYLQNGSIVPLTMAGAAYQKGQIEQEETEKPEQPEEETEPDTEQPDTTGQPDETDEAEDEEEQEGGE